MSSESGSEAAPIEQKMGAIDDRATENPTPATKPELDKKNEGEVKEGKTSRPKQVFNEERLKDLAHSQSQILSFAEKHPSIAMPKLALSYRTLGLQIEGLLGGTKGNNQPAPPPASIPEPVAEGKGEGGDAIKEQPEPISGAEEKKRSAPVVSALGSTTPDQREVEKDQLSSSIGGEEQSFLPSIPNQGERQEKVETGRAEDEKQSRGTAEEGQVAAPVYYSLQPGPDKEAEERPAELNFEESFRKWLYEHRRNALGLAGTVTGLAGMGLPVYFMATTVEGTSPLTMLLIVVAMLSAALTVNSVGLMFSKPKDPKAILPHRPELTIEAEDLEYSAELAYEQAEKYGMKEAVKYIKSLSVNHARHLVRAMSISDRYWAFGQALNAYMLRNDETLKRVAGFGALTYKPEDEYADFRHLPPKMAIKEFLEMQKESSPEELKRFKSFIGLKRDMFFSVLLSPKEAAARIKNELKVACNRASNAASALSELPAEVKSGANREGFIAVKQGFAKTRDKVLDVLQYREAISELASVQNFPVAIYGLSNFWSEFDQKNLNTLLSLDAIPNEKTVEFLLAVHGTALPFKENGKRPYVESPSVRAFLEMHKNDPENAKILFEELTKHIDDPRAQSFIWALHGTQAGRTIDDEVSGKALVTDFLERFVTRSNILAELKAGAIQYLKDQFENRYLMNLVNGKRFFQELLAPTENTDAYIRSCVKKIDSGKKPSQPSSGPSFFNGKQPEGKLMAPELPQDPQLLAKIKEDKSTDIGEYLDVLQRPNPQKAGLIFNALLVLYPEANRESYTEQLVGALNKRPELRTALIERIKEANFESNGELDGYMKDLQADLGGQVTTIHLGGKG